MTQVILKDVTDENREACLGLRLAEEQASYLPDVPSSLEMAERFQDARPLAIEDESGTIVGFAMYGIDAETKDWKIYRMIIDQEHQGIGLGSAATREILDVLRSSGASNILVCYQEDNEVARSFYAGFGFVEYGKDGAKVLAKLG